MNLLENLGIKTIILQKDYVKLELPITAKLLQPYGLVHGGINAVLAETAASLGANENLASGQVAVGVNITTQHLRKASSGTLFAKAIPVHIGTKLQTLEVQIYNAKQLTSLSTVTLTNISQN